MKISINQIWFYKVPRIHMGARLDDLFSWIRTPYSSSAYLWYMPIYMMEILQIQVEISLMCSYPMDIPMETLNLWYMTSTDDKDILEILILQNPNIRLYMVYTIHCYPYTMTENLIAGYTRYLLSLCQDIFRTTAISHVHPQSKVFRSRISRVYTMYLWCGFSGRFWDFADPPPSIDTVRPFRFNQCSKMTSVMPGQIRPGITHNLTSSKQWLDALITRMFSCAFCAIMLAKPTALSDTVARAL